MGLASQSWLSFQLEDEVIQGQISNVFFSPPFVARVANVRSEICVRADEATARVTDVCCFDEVVDAPLLGVQRHVLYAEMTADRVMRSGIVKQDRILDTRTARFRCVNVHQLVGAGYAHGPVRLVERFVDGGGLCGSMSLLLLFFWFPHPDG